MQFDELNIPHKVLAGVAKAGFHSCTPIQERTLPLALDGKDVMGQAQTGTGKTAAFLITVFSRLLTQGRLETGDKPAPRAVVIAPTRELVVQIERDAELLGDETGLKRLVVFGGLDYEKQRSRLAGNPDLLVGTPGRLIDYFRQGAYTLKGVEILVIDEADRMFDMGFIDDIRYMLRRMPPPGERQTLLFSATFPQRVKELAFEHMHEAIEVAVNPERVTADRITETLYLVSNDEKFSLLVGVLRVSALAAAPGNLPVAELMEAPVAVTAIEDVDAAADLREFFEGGPVPVVDHAGHLIGTIGAVSGGREQTAGAE